MAKFCLECGAKLSGGKFCSECGARLDSSEFVVGSENTGSLSLDEINSLFASEVTNAKYSSFEYEKRADGTYIIKKLKDAYAFSVEVPELTVVIEASAFEGTNIMDVILPEGLRFIGNRAFAGCKHLKRINIPSTVALIGDEVFLNCEKLDITIPQGIDTGADVIKGTLGAKIAEEKAAAEKVAKEKAAAEKVAAEKAAAKQENVQIDGNTVFFGEYPQTIKSNDVKIVKEADERGYYLGDDGHYYAKRVTIRPTYGDAKFSNGQNINPGEICYFKVEPIKWVMVYSSTDRFTVVSQKIIECRIFNSDFNDNYVQSDIKNWLNNELLDVSFTNREKERIITANGWQGKFDRHTYEFKNKIFLLTVDEVMDSIYGMNSNMSRQKKLTDYALANGALTTNGKDGYWWLRTSSSTVGAVRGVLGDGSVSDFFARPNTSTIGVVPSMQIKS